MAEMAVIVSFALLVVLGALQIFLLGFGQMSSDGAAFVASLAASTGYANPQGLSASIFPGIKQANISIDTTTSTGVAIGKATTSIPGIGSLPGLAALTTEQGSDIEPYTTISQHVKPEVFSFGVDANLANYCINGTSCASTHSMTLAQHLKYIAMGPNGQFEEWYCHQTAYQGLAFPSALPTPGPTWDVNNAASREYKIYHWDTGTTCP